MTQDRLDSAIHSLFIETTIKPTEPVIKLIKQFYNYRSHNSPLINDTVLRKVTAEVLSMSDEDVIGYITPDNIAPMSAVDASQRRDSFCRPGVSCDSNRQFDVYKKDSETSEYLLTCIRKCIFQDILNPRQQRNLVAAMKPLLVQEGEIMIEQGDFGDKMYFIESGDFEVVKDGVVIDHRGDGALIGEIALLHEVRRTATVRALKKSKVWVVTHDEYLAIKIVDDIHRDSIVKNVIRTDERFKGFCMVKKFLKGGEVIKDYFVVTRAGRVKIHGNINRVEKGNVINEGEVLDELEGAFLKK
ncbi:cGMP-dependent protein kinase 1 [Conglomerata obtusa]